MTAPSDTAREGKQPFIVHCGKCSHEWAAAYLPMEAKLFAKVTMRQHCPACGAKPIEIFCGPAPAKKAPDLEGASAD
jgi:formate dehydrogenase maturation protein FdhE